MASGNAETHHESQGSSRPQALTWVLVVLFVYLLLLGVGGIGAGFKWVSGGSEGAEQIFAFATNPIVGVILGTLATALVQSSSTVTSVIVGLVAGGVPVSVAVPMIMGANMGTTITNTIVSLGSINDSKSFNSAFRAATVHDFFNLYTILVFLPLEVLFKPLERLAGWMTSFMVGDYDASMKGFNFVGTLTKPPIKAIAHSLEGLGPIGGLLMIVVGIAVIMTSVIYLGKLLREVMTGPAKAMVENAIGRGSIAGIASGTVVTILVQSSSTTTSLIIPLAAAGVLTLRQVYPFTLGANIGTCITAVLAATSITGVNAEFAMQIALVHLMYNVFGVILFMLVPFLYSMPVKSAEWLGNLAEKNRGYAFGYLAVVFFVVPSTVLGGQYLLGGKDKAIIQADEAGPEAIEALEEAVQEEEIAIE